MIYNLLLLPIEFSIFNMHVITSTKIKDYLSQTD